MPRAGCARHLPKTSSASASVQQLPPSQTVTARAARPPVGDTSSAGGGAGASDTAWGAAWHGRRGAAGGGRGGPGSESICLAAPRRSRTDGESGDASGVKGPHQPRRGARRRRACAADNGNARDARRLWCRLYWRLRRAARMPAAAWRPRSAVRVSRPPVRDRLVRRPRAARPSVARPAPSKKRSAGVAARRRSSGRIRHRLHGRRRPTTTATAGTLANRSFLTAAAERDAPCPAVAEAGGGGAFGVAFRVAFVGLAVEAGVVARRPSEGGSCGVDAVGGGDEDSDEQTGDGSAAPTGTQAAGGRTVSLPPTGLNRARGARPAASVTQAQATGRPLGERQR